MNIKTYFDKSNTLNYNSSANTSQNPISEIFYGDGFSKFIFHFDTENIKKFVDDKTFCDMSKLKHTLKIKNAWGLEKTDNFTKKTKNRLSGFNIYLLRLAENWTEGSGRNAKSDIYINNTGMYSTDGSNWFNSSTETKWLNPISGMTSDNSEYLITGQTLQFGDEDINIDMTEEINMILSGTNENYGYMLCLSKILEDTNIIEPSYVSLITNKTTSIYKPFIETIYDDAIEDDRYDFYLDKTNRLYLYSIIGGEYANLDNFPTCTINDQEYTVKQATKGVYYVEANLSSSSFEPNTIVYDVWSNIVYNGKTFQDVEMEFVTLQNSEYFKFGKNNLIKESYIPSVYGIKHGEKINKGETRNIFVKPRIEYTTNNVKNIDGMEYRIYIKDGNDEVTIVSYDKINRTPDSNYFTIYSDMFQVSKYFIDVKIKRNGEEIIHKEKLMFEII